jgi:lipopolysaccharide exporter
VTAPEADKATSSTLQQRTVKGLQWSTTATMVNAVMQIGYASVVARLVSPEAFGLAAAGGVIMRFGMYFSEMGLGKAIIQKPELSERDIRAAATGTMALGTSFFLIFFILAPYFAPLLLADPQLVPVLRVMATFFLISGMGNIPQSLLRRRLAFKQLAQIEIGSYVFAYGVVGLTMALNGLGVWGLVVAGLTQNFLQGSIAYSLVRYPLKPVLERDAYKPLLGYGGRVSANSFLEFISANMDTFIIGRRMGAGTLGIYNRAFTLVQLPVQNLTNSVSRVLFPAISTIQHERERLKRVYLEAVQLLALLVFPLGAGLSVAGPEVVRVLLGDKWEAAIAPLQIISLIVPFKILMNFGSVIADATGKLNLKLGVEISYIIVMAPALYLVASSGAGLEGMAFMVLAGEISKITAYMFLLRPVLGYKIGKELLAGYIPGVSTGLIVGGMIWLIRFSMPAALLEIPALALLVEVVIGGLALGLGLLLPTARPVRTLLYTRFISKTALGNRGWVKSWT